MDRFFIQYVSLSHLLIFSGSYFLISEIYKKRGLYQFFFLLIFSFGLLVGSRFSNIDSLFLFMMYFLLSVYSSGKLNISSPLLFSVVPYQIEIITSFLTKPLFKNFLNANNDVGQTIWSSLVVVENIALVLLLSYYFKKKLYPEILKKNIQTPLSLFFTLLIFIYHTYWLIINYSKSFFLKYLVILFYIFLSCFIVIVLRSERRTSDLKYEMAKRESEYLLAKRYAEEIERQHEEIRRFRHDYLNIISSLEYYIIEGDSVGMKKYFETCIKPTQSIFQTNSVKLNDLNNIETLELRSIFMTKLFLAQNKGIDIKFDISEKIKIHREVNILALVRIFAILLDNAIEELEEMKHGKLIIAFIVIDDDIVVIIQNDTRGNIEPLYILNQEGYSTKGEHRGLGLSNIDSLLDSDSRLLLETQVLKKTFVQKVTILNGV